MQDWELIHNPYDRQAIEDLYEQLPHDDLPLSTEQFVRYIGWRIYTEWYLDPENKNIPNRSDNYKGMGFSRFIKEETHYALERKGFKWGDCNRFRELTPVKYKKVRDSVLKGLVRCAIDFFKETNGSTVRLGDNKNLRCSLSSWID